LLCCVLGRKGQNQGHPTNEDRDGESVVTQATRGCLASAILHSNRKCLAVWLVDDRSYFFGLQPKPLARRGSRGSHPHFSPRVIAVGSREAGFGSALSLLEPRAKGAGVPVVTRSSPMFLYNHLPQQLIIQQALHHHDSITNVVLINERVGFGTDTLGKMPV
jgi:hypothetical protein